MDIEFRAFGGSQNFPNFSGTDRWVLQLGIFDGKHRLHAGTPMTDRSDDGIARLLVGCSLAMNENQRAFERALHESTAIADRIREAIADAPPKLVMLALSDLLQEHLTRLVVVEPDKQQTDLSLLRERLLKVLS